MFRSMIIHATVMALAVFNKGHTHPMEVAEIVHVTGTIAVIQVGANLQDASVTGIVIVRIETRYHVGAVDHQII